MRSGFKLTTVFFLACATGALAATPSSFFETLLGERKALPIVKAIADTCRDAVRLDPRREKEFRKKVQSADFDSAAYADALGKTTPESCAGIFENKQENATPLGSRYLIWAPKQKATVAAGLRAGVDASLLAPGQCLTRRIELGSSVEIWNICLRDDTHADFKITPPDFMAKPTESKKAPPLLLWSRPAPNRLTIGQYKCSIRMSGPAQVRLSGCEIAATYDVVSAQ